MCHRDDPFLTEAMQMLCVLLLIALSGHLEKPDKKN